MRKGGGVYLRDATVYRVYRAFIVNTYFDVSVTCSTVTLLGWMSKVALWLVLCNCVNI